MKIDWYEKWLSKYKLTLLSKIGCLKIEGVYWEKFIVLVENLLVYTILFKGVVCKFVKFLETHVFLTLLEYWFLIVTIFNKSLLKLVNYTQD